MPHVPDTIRTTLRFAVICTIVATGATGAARAQPKADPKADPMDVAPSEAELRRRLEPLIPSIRSALQGDNPDAQRAALAVVADFPPGLAKDANLATALATYLQRDLKDPELISIGLRSFGRIDPDPAHLGKVASRFIKSEDAEIRRAASESLASALRNAVPSLKSVGNAAKFIEVSRQALPLIAEVIGDQDGVTQRAALDGVQTVARTLTDIYIFEAGPAGFDEPKPKDKNGRLAALDPVLKELTAIVPRSAAVFTAPEPATRIAAARVLESMGYLRRVVMAAQGGGSSPFAEGWPTIRPAVAARMKDESPAVRLAVTEALESLGDALEARELLREATYDRSVFVRWAAARALGRSAPARPDPAYEGAINALTRLVGDSDADVRTAALTALSRFGAAARSATPAVLTAATRGDVEPRVAAVKALSALETPADVTVPVLTNVLGDRDLRLRRAAASGLVRFGPEARPALPQLRIAVVDPDPELRLAAAEAILAIERTTRLRDL